MSWFNPKAFAAGALTELEDIVDTNFEEAKAYEEEQRELFKSNKKTIDQRRRLVNGYIGIANELSTLGASPAQIRAAHSSGLGNLVKLRDQVRTAVESRSGLGTTLSKDEVEAMITTGGVLPELDSQYDKMDFESFIRKSMNLETDGVLEVEPERNVLQKLLGGGEKASIKAKLDREIGSNNMSILDINEAASRSDYESLMPGSFASFSDGAIYDAAKAYNLFDSVSKRKIADVEKSIPFTELRTASNYAGMDRMRQEALKAHAIQQWTIFGKKAAEDPVIDYKSEGVLGADLYNELYLKMFGGSEAVDKALEKVGTNTVIIGPERYEITFGVDGKINKIILPKTETFDEDVITDKDKIKDVLSLFMEKGLLSGDLAGEVTTPQGFSDSEILQIEDGVEVEKKVEKKVEKEVEDDLKVEKIMEDIDSIIQEYPFYKETIEEYLGPDVDLTSTAALRRLSNSLRMSISDSGEGNKSARLRLLNAVEKLKNIDSGTEDSGEFNALDFAKKYLLGKNFGGDT